ncbi:hypothetical protein [Chryseolinea sp. H1M3-3]|uniref:hypothetical protein n=1 Tax=Chryseolinea sp. H1M3-3 TaxID=3034144 RepID=UPI0023ED0292|nr:hypothetical protein [Chryseolinea sp. H1M3-3]
MRKYLILISGLMISISAFSQKFELSIDSIIDLEIEKHKTRNISTIGYTKMACVNYGITATAYLFWYENDKTFFQKFSDSEYDKNPVQRFRPIEIIDSIFFAFYNANGDQLLSEEAESFAYRSDSTRQLYVSRPHSCFRSFKVFTKGKVLHKYFDFFDLREFKEDKIDNSKLSKERIQELKQMGWEVDPPTRNINFETNNTLKIVEWDLLISEFIEQMETENVFVEIEK